MVIEDIARQRRTDTTCHVFWAQLTRALERGGGQILPSPHVFSEYLSKYSFDRRDFFNTCPKINGAPFGAKIEGASIFWGLFLSPKVSTFVFRRADAMTGVSWRPPPPRTDWLGPAGR